MNVKKEIIRTCAVTREKLPKSELLRIVRTPDNEVVIDKSGKLNGRGVYLKNDEEVFALAKKRNSISRALKFEIRDSLYEELIHVND